MASIDVEYERWAYGEGWSAGLLEGRRHGYEEGYGAGFDAGAEIGAARVLLGIEHALGSHSVGSLPGLLPELAHVGGGYLGHRGRTASSNEPCPYGCRACARCIRAAAVAENMRRYGSADYPGTGTVQRGRS